MQEGLPVCPGQIKATSEVAGLVLAQANKRIDEFLVFMDFIIVVETGVKYQLSRAPVGLERDVYAVLNRDNFFDEYASYSQVSIQNRVEGSGNRIPLVKTNCRGMMWPLWLEQNIPDKIINGLLSTDIRRYESVTGDWDIVGS